MHNNNKQHRYTRQGTGYPTKTQNNAKVHNLNQYYQYPQMNYSIVYLQLTIISYLSSMALLQTE